MRDQAAYAAQLLSLAPVGEAWPRQPDSTFARLMDGVAAELARADARGVGLLAEFDPRTTVEMLADWERALGLPDPCAAPPTTLSARRRRAAQRYAKPGSLTPRYLIETARELGFEIYVEEFPVAETGGLLCGQPLNALAWRSALRIRAAETTVTPFRTGVSGCGEPLNSWGNESLECILRRIKPGHAEMLFAYAAVQTAFGAALRWQTPGPAVNAAALDLTDLAAGATFVLVGTFVDSAVDPGDEPNVGVVIARERVKYGASAYPASGAAVTVAHALPAATRVLLSVVVSDVAGQRTVRVRVNGADVASGTGAGVGSIWQPALVFASKVDHLGVKAWPLPAAELDWLERSLARQFELDHANWPQTPFEEA